MINSVKFNNLTADFFTSMAAAIDAKLGQANTTNHNSNKVNRDTLSALHGRQH